MTWSIAGPGNQAKCTELALRIASETTPKSKHIWVVGIVLKCEKLLFLVYMKNFQQFLEKFMDSLFFSSSLKVTNVTGFEDIHNYIFMLLFLI